MPKCQIRQLAFWHFYCRVSAILALEMVESPSVLSLPEAKNLLK